MRVHGSCHCGLIKFNASVAPSLTSVCHCNDCQKLTGTAFRLPVPAIPGSFHIESGEPKIYVKVAESGSHRAQAFCPECGSPLFTYGLENPTAVGVRVGVLDERLQLPPTWQKWCSSSMPWVQDISQLEQAQGNARDN
jgi:hypothetical protein